MTTATAKQPHLFLTGRNEDVAAWVAERIPDCHYGFKDCTAIGVVSGERMIAGVVYHQYQPEFGTIQLHIATESPMWARRETIRQLLAYPFIQLGVFKAWVCMAEDNHKAVETVKHIGFKREATLANQFGKGRHAVISRMYRPDFDRLYWKERA